MTPQEFAAACARLHLTIIQTAVDFDVERDVVEEWERGTRVIPRGVADKLRWRAAAAEREAILAASGLPECPISMSLEAIAIDKDGYELTLAVDERAEHARNCAVCRARNEYLASHAPPMPAPPPTTLWERAIAGLHGLLDRLPRPLRPPAGPTGDGRRTGLVAAAALTVCIATVVAIVDVASLLLPYAGQVNWLRGQLTAVAMIVIGYGVGFYVAGLVFDLTRRIRHRLIGYMVRGGLGCAAVFGTIAAVAPMFIDSNRLSDVPAFVALVTGLGAFAGASLWIWHRGEGKLPTPLT